MAERGLWFGLLLLAPRHGTARDGGPPWSERRHRGAMHTAGDGGIAH